MSAEVLVRATARSLSNRAGKRKWGLGLTNGSPSLQEAPELRSREREAQARFRGKYNNGDY